MNTQDVSKKAAGYHAANLIAPHMIVGLGTGSTAKYFIERLIERERQEHLHTQVVASSKRSLLQAQEGGLTCVDINTLSHIDITADGADEIDTQKRMIKGGGGALLREKIVASLSHEMIVIIDTTKHVPLLGARKVPVEVVPFACMTTLRRIQQHIPTAAFRMIQDERFVTDNGNYIIDISFPCLLNHPEEEHAILKEIPGVVETGFFFHLAGRVITGLPDGKISIS